MRVREGSNELLWFLVILDPCSRRVRIRRIRRSGSGSFKSNPKRKILDPETNLNQVKPGSVKTESRSYLIKTHSQICLLIVFFLSTLPKYSKYSYFIITTMATKFRGPDPGACILMPDLDPRLVHAD